MMSEYPFQAILKFRHKFYDEPVRIEVKAMSQNVMSDALMKVAEKFGKDYSLVV